SAIPNAHVLLSPLFTQEAVLSSRIEGTQATMGEVLEYEAKGGSVDIINRPDKDFLGRFAWKVMGRKKMSALVLNLEVEDQKIGFVLFLTRGYDQYTLEHAKLLELLHDPFAISLSNTLKHEEVLRLKDLLIDDNQYLNRQLHHMAGDEIIGSEFGLKYVMEMVRQIAPQKSQVLLLGETGAGKEVIANAIHYSSPRAGKPFIKVNCGAIPENLIDSELFGHEKGAFTGAVSQKRGRFERADKGTLFLDEVGELTHHAQVRLLRVLQNKEIERVGGTQPVPVDIRIITATHRNLSEMVSRGKFREDLWFRLNVFPIPIPPLRQRKSDIPALIRYFMEKKAREMNFPEQPVLAPGALEKLHAYHWPGNVRELENLVERTIIRNMASSSEKPEKSKKPLEFEPFFSAAAENEKHAETNISKGSLLMDDVMRKHIRKVLEIAGGKVQGEKGAAALLGVHPNTLRNRMNKLKIAYGRKK
ncbi:sigma 54-interacting transcriptional regulator, partial [Desulfobacterales bacterium HSG16]|nr:sigma 54-interacting transcriptional regulator [Desulfobacterales bacterium HSG16]